MRAIFGIVSLVVVLAIVALLSKKQLGAVSEIRAPAGGPASVQVDPQATVQQQAVQIQQQVKAAAEAAQQPHAMPDEK